ncbi:hypothetical protein DINM_000844 [Dirofilaria immitis]|nr:hypothetical protein [Dirofilaria immitis]
MKKIKAKSTKEDRDKHKVTKTDEHREDDKDEDDEDDEAEFKDEDKEIDQGSMKGLKDSGVKVQTKRITADELGAKEIIPDLIESGTVMESDATTSAGKRDKEGEGAEDSSRTGSMNYMARQGIWEAQSTGGKGNAGYGKSDVGVTTRPEARAGGQKIVYSVPGQSIDDYGKGGVGVADGPGNEVGGGIEYFMSKQSVDSYGKGGAGIGVRPGAEAGAVSTTGIKAASTAGTGAEGMGQKSAYFMPAQGAVGYGKGGVGTAAGPRTEIGGGAYFMPGQGVDSYGKGSAGIGVRTGAEVGAVSTTGIKAASTAGTGAEGMGQKSAYFMPAQGAVGYGKGGVGVAAGPRTEIEGGQKSAYFMPGQGVDSYGKDSAGIGVRTGAEVGTVSTTGIKAASTAGTGAEGMGQKSAYFMPAQGAGGYGKGGVGVAAGPRTEIGGDRKGVDSYGKDSAGIGVRTGAEVGTVSTTGIKAASTAGTGAEGMGQKSAYFMPAQGAGGYGKGGVGVAAGPRTEIGGGQKSAYFMPGQGVDSYGKDSAGIGVRTGAEVGTVSTTGIKAASTAGTGAEGMGQKSAYFMPAQGAGGYGKGGVGVAAGPRTEIGGDRKGVDSYGKDSAGIGVRTGAEVGTVSTTGIKAASTAGTGAEGMGQKSAYFMPAQGAGGYGKGGVGVAAGPRTEIGGGQKSAYFMPGQGVDSYGKGSAGIGVRTGAEVGTVSTTGIKAASTAGTGAEGMGQKSAYFMPAQGAGGYGKGGVGVAAGPRTEIGGGQKSAYFMPGQGVDSYGKDSAGIGVRTGAEVGTVSTTGIKAASTAGTGAEGMGQKSAYFMPAQGAGGYGKGGVGVAAGPRTEIGGGQKSAYFMPGQGVDSYGKGSAGIGVRTGAEVGAVSTTGIKVASTAGTGAEGMGQKSAYFMPAQGAVGYGKGGVGVAAGPRTEIEGGQKSAYFMPGQGVDSYGKGSAGIGVRTGAEVGAVSTTGIKVASTAGTGAEGMGQKSAYFMPGQGAVGYGKGGVGVAAGPRTEIEGGQKSAYFMPGQGAVGYGKGGVGVAAGPRTEIEGGQKSAYFMPGQGAVGYGKGGVGVAAGPRTEIGGGQKSAYFMPGQGVNSYGKGGAGIGIKPRAEAASAVGTAAIAEGVGQKVFGTGGAAGINATGTTGGSGVISAARTGGVGATGARTEELAQKSVYFMHGQDASAGGTTATKVTDTAGGGVVSTIATGTQKSVYFMPGQGGGIGRTAKIETESVTGTKKMDKKCLFYGRTNCWAKNILEH